MRSPFTGLRFARLEFDNFRAGKMIKLAICAIALIPLIYGGLFLLAFLDPYGNLSNVPAAVVNLDTGAKINGKTRNIGAELCDELVNNNDNSVEGQASGYDWQFVTQKKADRGLDNATYYMELIIPEDFSSDIASADSKRPIAASLQVYFNPATNLIAQTVGSSMVVKIKYELTGKIEQEYFNNIFLKIDEASDKLDTAVDGSTKLSDGLDALEDGGNTLSSGLTTLEEGGNTLSSGLDTLQSAQGSLTSGLQSAQSGASSLSSGISSAQSGSSKITKNLKKLAKGANKVNSGVGTLSKSLKKKIKSLKKTIKSAQSDTADLTTLLNGIASALSAYEATGQTSYLTTACDLAEQAQAKDATIGTDLNSYVTQLASAISSYSSKATASSEAETSMTSAAEEMTSALSDVSSAQSKLADAVGAVYAAGSTPSGTLVELMTAAATTTATNTSIATKLENNAYNSLDDLKTDADSLVDSTGTLLAKVSAVTSSEDSGGVPYMLGYLEAFQEALESYQDKASAYQQAAVNYQSAATEQAASAATVSQASGLVTGYLQGVSNTSKKAQASTKSTTAKITKALNKLNVAISDTLQSGTSQLASGANKLTSASKTLTLGLGSAYSGSEKLISGLKAAHSGSSTLSLKTSEAASGASTLAEKIGEAADGADTIADKTSSAADGANELAEGLEDGADELAESISNKTEKAKMMSTPVTANGDQGTGESITEVANYGTGFAPYFIGLAMWVGALMVSFLISALNRRILMSGASSISATLASYIPMAIICIVQAMLLLLFIQFVLGMNIKYPAAFYAFGVLTACCFAAIIQFFRASLGTVGLVVIVVLLMLQLCTAAGTFPIEAELPFFNWLNPYLPMTYVVQGFRMSMAGLSLSYMTDAVWILLAFTFAFLCLTVLWARHKRCVALTDLYPPIQLAS